mmetsp:Transcript_2751/g.7207  ORF Transcript_2751/g.7207 Transcript_2751/m.7207 type:complete len:231 (+) Transcript_2751:185-877(+)
MSMDLGIMSASRITGRRPWRPESCISGSIIIRRRIPQTQRIRRSNMIISTIRGIRGRPRTASTILRKIGINTAINIRLDTLNSSSSFITTPITATSSSIIRIGTLGTTEFSSTGIRRGNSRIRHGRTKVSFPRQTRGRAPRRSRLRRRGPIEWGSSWQTDPWRRGRRRRRRRRENRRRPQLSQRQTRRKIRARRRISRIRTALPRGNDRGVGMHQRSATPPRRRRKTRPP